MLHLVFHSPIEAAIWERIDSNDIVVFLENAVLRILQNSSVSNTLIKKISSTRFCVLSDDIAVRGIAPNELVEGIEIIDYAGLVELTVNNPTIHSWT